MIHTFYRFLSAFLVCLFLLSAFMPTLAEAAEFAWHEEEATISGPIDDDLYAAGGILRIDSSISQDVHAIGQEVHVSGSVGDDALLLGGVVVISGEIEEDAFVAASSLSIAPEAHIKKDAFLAGEIITIEGRIDGNVRIFSNNVTIQDGAVIGGNLFVRGGNPIIEDGAVIEGSVRVNPMQARETGWSSALSTWVRQVLTLFIVAAVVAYFLPAWTKQGAAALRKKPLRSLLAAILWILLIIPATVILALTLIGIPLAVIAFFGTIILYILAMGVAALLIGNWITEKISGSAGKSEQALLLTWPNALIGAAVFATVNLLGFFGSFLGIIFTLLVFGALLRSCWHKVKPAKQSL